MAKILMIQFQNTPYIGTAYLNGAVKSAGHQFVLHLGDEESAAMNRIEQEKPDMIGFSCMTGIHTTALKLASSIKHRTSTPVMMGGPHPTLFPEVIEHEGLDVICRGEGEFALMDALNAIDAKQPLAGIPNLWVKENGKIHKADPRPLTDPLDQLPPLDWSCYQGTAAQSSSPVAFPIRGCPFSCSYCFNANFREFYHVSPRQYIRHFSVERAIEETRAAVQAFEPNPVLFTSDTFGIDLDWMDRFLTSYSREFKRPFVLLLRPEYATEPLVDILARHQCHSVAIGVESGSERVRSQLLNRKYSNQYLIEVADRLHRAGIKFRTYNMVGLPGETEEEMWETIDINVRMKADYPRCAIFSPMPGTKLTDKAIAEGYLDPAFSFDDVPFTILSKSILKNVDTVRIQNTMYLFQTAVRWPWLRKPLRWLTRWKHNGIMRWWFYLVYAWLHRKSEDRHFFSYLRYVFVNRKQL